MDENKLFYDVIEVMNLYQNRKSNKKYVYLI